MVPWSERLTLEIDLDQPLECRFAGVPALAQAQQLLAAVMSQVPSSARLVADWVRVLTGGRFHAEAISLARQIDTSWRDVLLANVSYDLLTASFSCSTVVLPTPEGPVVARNMDWAPADLLARSSYLLRCTSRGELRLASAGWPGSIGVVTGLSGRGFAVVVNAVTGEESGCRTGYPVLLHLRRVLEDARDFDQALRMLAEQRLAAPALITLAGSRNDQRVVIERSPTRHAFRWPRGDEPLVTTNDYRELDFRPEAQRRQNPHEPEIHLTTCSRYTALCRFFKGHRADAPVQDAALLYILSDPAVIQSITAQHVIMRPRLGQVRLLVPRRLLGVV